MYNKFEETSRMHRVNLSNDFLWSEGKARRKRLTTPLICKDTTWCAHIMRSSGSGTSQCSQRQDPADGPAAMLEWPTKAPHQLH